MYVLVVYDISSKAMSKVLKLCRFYLFHVQKSVFEGYISPAHYNRLKNELAKVIDPERDSVLIYQFGSPRYASKEQLGPVKSIDFII